ncbi:hypothetical protein HY227_01365 [Candidatus Wolfebacteria bacterium]|nr:hypothetical protein [Candidatus Wolfebacteria bacterium]
MSIFLISLPVFLIIFSGWILKKIKIAKDEWIHILNQFAYYVSLPALIIASFWDVDFASKNFLAITGISFITIILFSAVIFFKTPPGAFAKSSGNLFPCRNPDKLSGF